jgi:hypothetical protein
MHELAKSFVHLRLNARFVIRATVQEAILYNLMARAYYCWAAREPS